MELAMKDSGIWLSTVLKRVREGVIGVDSTGGIVWMNPAAERLTGLKAPHTTDRAADDVFSFLEKEPRNPLGPALRSVLDRGAEVHVSDHELFCADSRPVCVDYTIVPILKGSECRGAVIFLSENVSGVADAAMPPDAYQGGADGAVQDLVERVLVMDDDDVVRNLTVQKLIRLGYESDGASNGEEAVSKFKAARDSGKPYDVVVLDLIIRDGMGGRETLEMLKDVDPDVKAILTSGHAVDPVLTNFWEYGFFGVIRKPFVIKELDVTIRQALEEE
jgi:CheY-like chemotaxis protein